MVTHRTALAPGGLATVKAEEEPVPGVGDPGDEGRLISDYRSRRSDQDR